MMGAVSPLATDRNLLVAARRMMKFPGNRTEAARKIGLSVSHLHAVVNGSMPITPTVRAKLLANVDSADLELADKICAEWGWVERV